MNNKSNKITNANESNTGKVESKNKLIVGQSFSKEVGIGLPIVNGAGYSKGTSRFLPFSGDARKQYTANIFPQILARLAFDSPTNGAALQRKSMMTFGEGINLSELNSNLRKTLEKINAKGETANDLLKKMSMDYVTFGGFALKITWGYDGYIKFVEHLPFTNVRCGEPNEDNEIDYFVVSNNWDNTLTNKREKTYALPKFNESYWGKDSVQIIKDIPTPTDEQLEQAEQILYYTDYKPFATNGQQYYPIPDYVAALDSIQIEKEIIISNKALIDNGIGGKYVLTFPFQPTTREEMVQNDINITQQFTSASNNGGVIKMYAADKDSLPQLNKLDALDADTYNNVAIAVKQDIITAHQIPAILLEYNYGGGFNNRAEEMVTAYNQFQQTNIKSYQNNLIRVWKRLCSLIGWTADNFTIIPFNIQPIQDAPTNVKVDTTLAAKDGKEITVQGETSLNQGIN